jgi:hypothetical protein
MSSVPDEHIVNNSSNYQRLESYSLNNNHLSMINNSTSVNGSDLIDRIMFVVNERLDDAQQCKNVFNNNSMQPAFYQVLCEIKDKIGINFRK